MVRLLRARRAAACVVLSLVCLTACNPPESSDEVEVITRAQPVNPGPAFAAVVELQTEQARDVYLHHLHMQNIVATRALPRTRTVMRAASAAPAITAGSVNGYPCGGDLPPCYVLARESGGNPTAQNPRSTASGLWQFLDSTWANYAGYPKARLAPPDVQNEKARLTWAGGRGCAHWNACR